jgi:hypothetical protein
MMTGSDIARLTQSLDPIITLVLWSILILIILTYVRDSEN